MMRKKIAYPHRSYCFFVVKSFKSPPGIFYIVLPVVAVFKGHGPMYEIKVDIIAAEVFKRLFERPEGVVVSVVVVPQFCGDKYVIATDITVNYSVFNALFVAVKCGSINKTIPCFDSRPYPVFTNISRRRFIRSVAYFGYFYPVVKRFIIHCIALLVIFYYKRRFISISNRPCFYKKIPAIRDF